MKTFGPRDNTLYGPSYRGERGGPGALRRMKTKSSEERAGGDLVLVGDRSAVWWVSWPVTGADSLGSWWPVGWSDFYFFDLTEDGT